VYLLYTKYFRNMFFVWTCSTQGRDETLIWRFGFVSWMLKRHLFMNAIPLLETVKEEIPFQLKFRYLHCQESTAVLLSELCFIVAVKRIKPDLTFVYIYIYIYIYISTQLILFWPLHWLNDCLPCLHSFISLWLLGYVFLGSYFLDIFAFSI
jgi:hypothetical protein